MWSYNHTSELYHHGIKGMKWGRRRYQNKDGSLTVAGKKRYDDKSDRIERNKKINKEIRESGYTNPFGYHAVGAAKTSVLAGAGAIATAAVSSAAVFSLSKAGKQAAATSLYTMSSRMVSTMIGTAKVSAGYAAINAMMGGPGSIKKQINTEKAIRKKYEE